MGLQIRRASDRASCANGIAECKRERHSLADAETLARVLQGLAFDEHPPHRFKTHPGFILAFAGIFKKGLGFNSPCLTDCGRSARQRCAV
ncbi:hypothetical protein BH10PLA2_BH10PLA2_25970 [soil metagenome]